MKTFKAKTQFGTETKPYIESFKLFDQEFVIHETLNDEDLFRVSHKESGIGVPLTESKHVELSKRLAIAELEFYGKDKFMKTLEKDAKE